MTAFKLDRVDNVAVVTILVRTMSLQDNHDIFEGVNAQTKDMVKIVVDLGWVDSPTSSLVSFLMRMRQNGRRKVYLFGVNQVIRDALDRLRVIQFLPIADDRAKAVKLVSLS